jgi:hypothetical protein
MVSTSIAERLQRADLHAMKYPFAVALAFLSLTTHSASAQTPSSVFATSRDAIFIVRATRTSGVVQGSAVQIDKTRAITNCHVVNGATRINLENGGQNLLAVVLNADQPRDLCILESKIPFRGAPPPIRTVSTLQIGERVVALGAPRNLELTLSEGIVSGVRQTTEGQLIQTTAPISPGSSGGALLDMQGRLIGVTSFQRQESQNINFAAPADWISEIKSRSEGATTQAAPLIEPRLKFICKGSVRTNDPILRTMHGSEEWSDSLELELDPTRPSIKIKSFLPRILMRRSPGLAAMAAAGEPYKLTEVNDIFHYSDSMNESTGSNHITTTLSISLNRKSAEFTFIDGQMSLTVDPFSQQTTSSQGNYQCERDTGRKF